MGTFTLFIAIIPAILGKVFRLGRNGIEKVAAGEFYEGTVKLLHFSTIHEFVKLITEVTVAQAISSSVPISGVTTGRIVTKANATANPGALTRSKKDMGFLPGVKGMLPVDYDPEKGQPVCQPDELWKLLVAIAPDVAHAGAGWWCSSGSYICNGDEEIYGLRGQRLYVMIDDISDTERVGKVLFKRLWLAGHGYISISSSGQRLVRTVFDMAMYEAARMDYIGGAVCEAPLVQKRPPPMVLSDGGWLNTRTAFKDLTPAEELKYEAMVHEAKVHAEAAANEARERWKQKRRDAGIKKLTLAGVSVEEASERVERSLAGALSGTLMGDFEINLADGEAVNVGTILGNRERYDGALTFDPLEPEYANHKVVGKLYLYGATPMLNSFARGGAKYRLRRQPHRIYAQRGRKSELVDEIRKVLAGEPDVFLRGGTLVHVDGGKLRQLRKHNLAHLIGTRTAIYTKNEKGQDIAADVPSDVVEMVIATMEGA